MVALHVELALHAFRAGQRRRVDEHEAVATAALTRLVLEPREAVRVHEAVVRAGEPVQREVALRPVEVSLRHVDGGRSERSAAHRVDGRGAGVGEEIQEAPPRGEFAHATTRDAVVEKKTGVEVVREVDEEAVRPFTHFVERRLGIDFLVLLAVALAATHAQRDAFRRQSEHLGQHRQRLVATAARRVARYGRRCCVLLHTRVALAVTVKVDREGVLRHVCVVDAVAGDVLAPGPGLESREVLPEPVREHRGPGTLASRGLSLAAHGLGIGLDRLGAEFETQQPALDGPVEERVRTVSTEPQGASERGVPGEHARLPAGESLDERAAERRVGGPEGLLVLEARAVGRVHEHEAERLRRLRQRRDLAPFDYDVVPDPGAGRIGQRRTYGGLVAIVSAHPALPEGVEVAARKCGFAERFPRRGIVL